MPRIVPLETPCDVGEVELQSDPRGEITQLPPAGYKFCFVPGELTPAEVAGARAQAFQGSLLMVGVLAVGAWLLYRILRPGRGAQPAAGDLAHESDSSAGRQSLQ